MKASLVRDLRCPVTGEPLELGDVVLGAGAEIRSGRLTARSGPTYPIVEGVPIMVVPDTFAAGQAETRESFSEKWRRAPRYREATHAHYLQWYLDRYGFNTVDGLRDFLQSKRRILDAGTGHGRDSELFARNSAATVFGIDISDGIYNAYRDLEQIENLHLIQA